MEFDVSPVMKSTFDRQKSLIIVILFVAIVTYTVSVMHFEQVIASEDLAATAIEAVERWAPLARHPHIVAIRESFVSREVEDTAALFFVHDFYPGALTLQRMHLQQEQAGGVVHLNVSQ